MKTPTKQPTLAVMIAEEPQSKNNPDASAESAEAMYVPADAVAIDGQSPAIGDDVEFTVKGTVKSVDGKTLCITPSTINDQPYQAPEPASEPNSDDMMAEAMKADGQAEG